MNAYNRRYFTTLLPCRCCGMEPMRVYCNSTDLYAVKCDCGRRTKGFTTIAGASRSWNSMNKKEPPARVPVPQAAREKGGLSRLEMKSKKQRCSKCGAGVNDTHHWYDCGDGMYCEDCFKDWARDYLDSNPEDIAPLMNVSVWDVMEKEDY